MNEPKIPEESRDWEAINIFLFSNGQQHTPPRKYHLVLDELKSWDNVKRYLAHSQYGTQTSTIELYSLDGKKIYTPLELTDSAAYVAIKPTEEFIQTGYSQYLIKASRSWEKRQETILKSEDMSVAEDANVKNVQSKSDITTGIEYVKIVNDLTSSGQVLNNAVVNNNKTVTKPNLAVNTAQFRKNNLVIKRQQHKTISADKNRSNDPTACKDTENQVNSKRKEISYLKCIKGTTKRPSVVTKNLKDEILKQNLNPKVMAQTNNNSKKVSKAEIETDLKIILSNQNTPTHKSEIDMNFKIADVDSKSKQTNTIFKERENLQITQLDEATGLQNTIGDNGNNNFKKVEDSLSLIENRMKSISKVQQTKDQSISIDRGGVIKLKFNIEVRDFQPYTNQDKRTSLKTTQSYIPFIATEKASLVNINTNLSDVTLLKCNEGFLKREESLETLLTINRDIFSTDNNPKIIIINCSCNQFDADSKSIQIQAQKNNGNLIYLMHSKENDEKIEICTCDKNYFVTKREDQAATDSLSNKNTDRRVSISPEALYHTPETSADRKEIQNDTAQHQRKMSIPQNELVKQDVQTQSEGINQTPQIENTGTDATTAKHDKETQTEWCNIMLEARRQEDGHYALHLPPLHTLLRYNFQ